MNKEWGTPISKDKIIFRRNKLIEWQKIGELRFTPLYEIIDENILDINYMIYEIDRLNNIINELEKGVSEAIKQLELLKYIDKYRFTYDREFQKAIDKLKELKEGNKYENIK